MLVTVPDAGLHEILASQALLLQLWPGAAEEVITLLRVLQLTMPSLADALAFGIVVLIGAGQQSAIVLRWERTTVTAIGRDAHGEQVPDPGEGPQQICHLEVRDVAVDGQSVLTLRSAATVNQ